MACACERIVDVLGAEIAQQLSDRRRPERPQLTPAALTSERSCDTTVWPRPDSARRQSHGRTVGRLVATT
jgi:hypothetical protein